MNEKEFTLPEHYVEGITVQTFLRWANVEQIKHTERVYYTIQEVVTELNNCSGSDCYNCFWDYKVDENGRVYEDIVTYTYHFKE